MTLDNLPSELLLQIYNLLQPEDWLHLGLTNHRILDVVGPRLRSLQLSYYAHHGTSDDFFSFLDGASREKGGIDFACVWCYHTMLEEMITFDYADYARALLDHGAARFVSPNSMVAREDPGSTLLHLAASKGGRAVVQLLMEPEYGFDPFALDEDGYGPLHVAVCCGSLETAKVLIEEVYLPKGVDIDPEDSQCPLILGAVRAGMGFMMLYLLENHAYRIRVNARGKYGETAMHWLMRNSRPPDERDDYDEESQYIPDEDMEVKVLRALAAAGADPMLTAGGENLTPLHVASQEGLYHLVPHLVAAGADVSERCASGGTPLHWAARNGDTRTIDALLAAGANPHATDEGSRTALIWTCHSKDPQPEADEDKDAGSRDLPSTAAWHLLKHGHAQINHTDEGIQNVLHHAAYHGRTTAVFVLIYAGMDVNIQTINGSTALHLAALSGSRETARMVLRGQPDLDILNTLDQTALEVAVEKGHTAVADIIELYRKNGVEAVGGRLYRMWETRDNWDS